MQHFSIVVYQCDAFFGLSSSNVAISIPQAAAGEDDIVEEEGTSSRDSSLPFCRQVRSFDGHKAPITAMTIVPDSLRYVVSASADSGLYLWDLSAGVCVGQYRMPSPVSSLNFHPDALFMITTHLGEKGAYLWTNNLRYGFVPDVVTRLGAVDNLSLLHFPVAHVEQEDGDSAIAPLAAAASATPAPAHSDVVLFDTTKDIALQRRERDAERAKKLNEILCPGLRLSGLPTSVWATLPLLDQIKQKNQPILPPKKRDVPFFLPTTSELKPTFLVPLKEDPSAISGRSHHLSFHEATASRSPFQTALLKEDHQEAMRCLKVLSAFEIDIELKRAVDYMEDTPYLEEEINHIRQTAVKLIRFLSFWVQARENADLVQGMLADVVKSHGRVMSRLGNEVISELEKLVAVQDVVRQEMEHLHALPNAIVGVSTGAF